jgi:hypothetical protein
MNTIGSESGKIDDTALVHLRSARQNIATAVLWTWGGFVVAVVVLFLGMPHPPFDPVTFVFLSLLVAVALAVPLAIVRVAGRAIDWRGWGLDLLPRFAPPRAAWPVASAMFVAVATAAVFSLDRIQAGGATAAMSFLLIALLFAGHSAFMGLLHLQEAQRPAAPPQAEAHGR